MSKNTKITVGIIIIILIIVIGGIWYGVSKKPQEEGVIKIGLIVASTGPAPVYGEWQTQGAEIAVEELQKEGTEVNLIIEDSKGEAKEAVTAINKLISINGINIIISGSFSRSVMAMAPIANENKVILFSTLSSSPGVTEAGDYVFRNRISGALESEAIAEEMNKQNINKAAFITFNDEAGYSYAESFKRLFGEEKIVAGEYTEPGQSDFRTEITKIKAEKPEAVFLMFDVNGVGRFLKRAEELGLETKFFATSAVQSEDLFETAGETAEGLVYATEGILKNNEKYKVFEEKYKSRYGSEPTIYAINSYDAVKIMTELIQEFGYNTEKIKEALYEREFDEAEGIFSFDSNGDIKEEVILKIVKNGEFVPYEE